MRASRPWDRVLHGPNSAPLAKCRCDTAKDVPFRLKPQYWDQRCRGQAILRVHMCTSRLISRGGCFVSHVWGLYGATPGNAHSLTAPR
jgi:hypothetical protein